MVGSKRNTEEGKMSDLLSREVVMKTALEWFFDVFGATDLTGLEERLMEL